MRRLLRKRAHKKRERKRRGGLRIYPFLFLSFRYWSGKKRKEGRDEVGRDRLPPSSVSPLPSGQDPLPPPLFVGRHPRKTWDGWGPVGSLGWVGRRLSGGKRQERIFITKKVQAVRGGKYSEARFSVLFLGESGEPHPFSGGKAEVAGREHCSISRSLPHYPQRRKRLSFHPALYSQSVVRPGGALSWVEGRERQSGREEGGGSPD